MIRNAAFPATWCLDALLVEIARCAVRLLVGSRVARCGYWWDRALRGAVMGGSLGLGFGTTVARCAVTALRLALASSAVTALRP